MALLKKAPRFWLSAAAMSTLLLTGQAIAQSKVVKVDGSSTVYPITEAVVEEFQTETKGSIAVTIGVSGTGGGFKKFGRGEIDVTAASRPIRHEEIDECVKNGIEFIELPIAFDALTVVINKQNTWARTMTVAELKKLWEPEAQGKIMTWSQVNPAWPDTKINLFGAGTDSGTFEYFTEAVVGKAKASRGDYTASEDDNTLVKGVEGDKNALGYFGMSYYLAHKDKLDAVGVAWDKNKATQSPVSPTPENVINASYAPLSRPLFIYVSKNSVDTKPAVRQFVRFYLDNAKVLAGEVKYVPLPDEAYAAVRKRFTEGKTGTAFHGEAAIGMKIEDIVSRESE